MTNKTDETQELSPFLKSQAEIMAARTQQDRDIEERQKHALVPAVNETAQSKINPDNLVIDRLNLETGETSSRVVQLTPQPTQRFIKPAPLTLDEVREQLVNAGNSIDSAKEQYQSDTDSLDAFYQERNALKSEITEILTKLNEKQGRLRELESAGTPKDQYLTKIIASEREVVGIAGALFTTLSEQAAQRIFGIPFNELSDDGKRDASARFRKVFQRFTSGFYVRLGRTAKTATVDQIGSRADELLNDVSDLIDSEYLK
jgi:chromosome segregation ATPase